MKFFVRLFTALFISQSLLAAPLQTGAASAWFEAVSTSKHAETAYNQAVAARYSAKSTQIQALTSLVSSDLENHQVVASAGMPGQLQQQATTDSVISAGNITITGTGDAQADQKSAKTVGELTSRDASSAGQGLSNTLTLQQAAEVERNIKTAQQNAQAAQLVGSVLSTAIGDLGKANDWKDGSLEKTVLHGMSGIVQAALGDTSALSGFVAGVVNEKIVGKMGEYLVEQGVQRFDAEGKVTKEFAEYITAGTALVGSAVGALSGGGAAEVAAGAQIAATATANNYLKHAELVERSSKNQDCKSGDPAACSRVQELDALSENRMGQTHAEIGQADVDAGLQIQQKLGNDMLGLSGYQKELKEKFEASTNPQERMALSLKINEASNHVSQIASLAQDNLLELYAKTQDAEYWKAYQTLQASRFGNGMADAFMSGAAVAQGGGGGGKKPAPGVEAGVGTPNYGGTTPAYGTVVYKDVNGNLLPVGGAPGGGGGSLANSGSRPSAVDPVALETLTANGVKFTKENVLATGQAPDGKVIFLETGTSTAGLKHIVQEHAKDFKNIGVSESQIPGLIMRTVLEGRIVGYQGKGVNRPIYEVLVNGQLQKIAVTVGGNGYIVGANPAGSVR